MAGVVYNNAKELFLLGDLHLDTDTINVALMTSAYTPNIDTDVFFNDIDANEASGTGYTAGGMALASKTVTQDNTNDRAAFDAADTEWTTITITARYYVIYVDGATAGVNDYLIGYESFGSDQSATAGTFTIQWDTTGILLLT